MKEFIICAAIKCEDTGKIFYGHRHHHCFSALNDELSYTMNRQEIAKIPKTQGFITSAQRFVTRKEAMEIAKECYQLKKDVDHVLLYSEDIY